MKSVSSQLGAAEDPCLQIQVDLSAMLDGELDAASVRRVMVHSDACPSCRGFLDGIRFQARTHRDLHLCLTADPNAVIEVHADTAGRRRIAIPVAELRKQLTENRQQLARIFYELGRGFVLMGMSPNFSRIVEREPVPIPDMRQRGRNLVDEVERLGSAKRGGEDLEAKGSEWVRARELFDGSGLGNPRDNLVKGRELLHEALLLDPDFHEARIYLGHAHHVAGDEEEACDEFRRVLESSAESRVRAFAQLNLGNVYLEAGRLADAAGCFRELVESGTVQDQPQFGLVYFNLALAYGMQERFEECESWLSRLYSEMPHKRRMIAEEFRSREHFLVLLSRRPDVYSSLSNLFPCWFPKKEAS